jgi:hypothetical protein
MPARCRDSATLRQAAFDDVIADRNLHSGPDLDPSSQSPLSPRFPLLEAVSPVESGDIVHHAPSGHMSISRWFAKRRNEP